MEDFFKQPAYVKPFDPKGDVIVFGKSPEQEAQDRQDGVARFGGIWRRPSYPRAYLRASEVLVSHSLATGKLDDLGLPIFYLQRHALELILKDLLGWVHEICAYRARREEADLPTAKDKERLGTSHKLLELYDDLLALSARLQLHLPPEKLKVIAQSMAAIEMTDTWSRYAYSRIRGSRIGHVESEVVVPIVEFQNKLEDIEATVLHNVGTDGTYESHLYYEWLSEARAAGEAG